MSINLLQSLIILAPVVAGGAISVATLSDIAAQGVGEAARVQSINDAGLVQAATVAWQMERGVTTTPTLAELVAAGYIDEAFLNRDMVDTSPVVLPDGLAGAVLTPDPAQ